MSASVDTGECVMLVDKEKTQQHNFGPRGLRIIVK